ncbi:ABC transporter ATP-binding protein [Actinoplanes sp. NBRC 103695]|uniref:ATP-binding cassette domain-containing protein n=1 Tax=Actinoplanes sp. NBRC 103695 TaxID=3032202 RepID=UPI0024A1BFA7|nr:ABC transporter ATP-binding protein [Actinoplanes sp. NBRC 103695]GLY93953.1 ABC transporter ATP-binding protein [Actinoplanes sp. NBRC 103695]
MRRELRFGASALRRRPLLVLLGWSVPEALPVAVSGLAVARAVDGGFLVGEPLTGVGWLLALLVAAAVGSLGSRQVYRRLGDLVEPLRDDLVRRVVSDALHRGVTGGRDDGALARLTRQVEVVRDTYAGMVVVLRGFLVSMVAAVAGLLALAPVIVLLIMPPFLVGVAAFAATLGLSVNRYRASVRAEERVAAATGAVLAGLRDVVASGAEDHAAELAGNPIAEQAAAERALAKVAALRTLCFAVGGWLPLVILLGAAGRLSGAGLSAGEIIGGLMYVLFGMQPALSALIGGVGGSGLRFVVTLGRILDAGATSPPLRAGAPPPSGHEVRLSGVTFAYGPQSEPVLRGLGLTIPEGDHLVVVGPSGVGKSTLAALLCGLVRPDEGSVLVGGVDPVELPAAGRAGVRVLIPQEAYVFTGTVRSNLVYLRPFAKRRKIADAVRAVGAAELIERLGGLDAVVSPGSLSAGERQLLALVRAYLSPARLVVLDEATCHLDHAAERRAEEAFAAREGTLVVIAHRISSALRGRRVLVLDGASAVIGDHEAVVAGSALYRDLLGRWEAAPQADKAA